MLKNAGNVYQGFFNGFKWILVYSATQNFPDLSEFYILNIFFKHSLNHLQRQKVPLIDESPINRSILCCLGIQARHAREKHSVCSGFPTSTLLLTFHPSLLTHSFSLSFFAVYLYSDLHSCLTSYGLLSDDIPRSQKHSEYSNQLTVLSEHHKLPPLYNSVSTYSACQASTTRNSQYRLFLDIISLFTQTQSCIIFSLPGSTKGVKNCMNLCFNSDKGIACTPPKMLCREKVTCI